MLFMRFYPVVASASLATPNWAEGLTAITSVVTAVAVVFAVQQVVLHNRQTHRDFESMYLQRFWEVDDRKSEALCSPEEFRAINIEASHHAYLNLSNDQVSLRRLGRITDGTWRFWEEEIYAFCDSATYRTLIENDMGRNYRHLLALLNHHATDQGPRYDLRNQYDPLTWGRAKRWRNGL